MSYRMKITLPDPIVAQLEGLAAQRGEPISRIASQMVSNEIAKRAGASHEQTLTLGSSAPDLDPDRHAPWIEPFLDPQWRVEMWGSIVALHGRYRRALAHLQDGWWRDSAHLETLCALVVWRDWIDQAADDPRHELAFQAQLTDFSRELRQEGGSISSTWQPGAPPEAWIV